MLSTSCIRRGAAALATCLAVFAPAFAHAGPTTLTLINGWTNTPFNTAKASISALHGVAHFKGAISTSGSDSHPFVLPVEFRPASTVYVPVDMCNATNGRLVIFSNGNVDVQAESDFTKAQCLTSLDGASFVVSPDGYKAMKLKNGWIPYGSGTAIPTARNIGGVVHLTGAMKTTGTNPLAFVLPAALRPAATVYVKADLCGAQNGRFEIHTDGKVFVETENGFSNAQCFTSLDGVSFALDATGYSNLTLVNGWGEYGNGTANAAVTIISGTVTLRGAIGGASTSATAFVLPAGLRPTKVVYVPVDQCGATNGRLVIDPSGGAFVEAEGDFSDAQCFTSLDGVSFHQ